MEGEREMDGSKVWARKEAERLVTSFRGVWRGTDSATRAKLLASYEFRPSDVVVTTFLKSGTVLLQQMCYQIAVLCTNTPPPPSDRTGLEFDSIMCSVPWIEMAHVFNLPPSTTSPRVYKTHLPVSAFDSPVRGGAPKHVVVLRDPAKLPASVLNFAFPPHHGIGNAVWRDMIGCQKPDGCGGGVERAGAGLKNSNGKVVKVVLPADKENFNCGEEKVEEEGQSDDVDWSRFHPDVLQECLYIVTEETLLNTTGNEPRQSSTQAARPGEDNNDINNNNSHPQAAPSMQPSSRESQYDSDSRTLSSWHAFTRSCTSSLLPSREDVDSAPPRDVLVLFYEDVVADLESAVRTVAAFMGCALTDDLVKLVAERCDRTYMSTDAKFRASVMQRPFRLRIAPRQTLPASYVGFKKFSLKQAHLEQLAQLNMKAFGVSTYDEMKRIIQKHQQQQQQE